MVDKHDTFYGAIDLKDLIIARDSTDLTTIMTCNDLVAVISYYGLAWIILINLLHF